MDTRRSTNQRSRLKIEIVFGATVIRDGQVDIDDQSHVILNDVRLGFFQLK
jgi:hypothetical protein